MGLSFQTAIFNNNAKYLAVENFFDLYKEGNYKKALQVAEIIFKNNKKRDFSYILLEAAKIGVEYYDKKEILNNKPLPNIEGDNDRGFFTDTNRMLLARNFFKNKDTESGKKVFSDFIKSNPDLNIRDIENTLLWILEKFSLGVKYRNGFEEYEKFEDHYKVLTILEPELSFENISFDRLLVSDMNRSCFSCLLKELN